MSATTPEIEEEETQKSKQTCRYYSQKYPEVDDLVMVKVKSIAEMGAYVSLLEYDNIEGMILLSELSRKRIRSVSKLIRVGRKEVVVVLRVDKEKGYIDLSKKRVSPEDQKKCEEKYTKSKTVNDIMRLVADKCEMKLEDLNTQIAWPLYQKFGHAYDAFKLAIADKEKAFEGMTIPKDVEEKLVDVIQKKLKPQPVKIRADIEVTCFSYEGIDAIKAALKAGEAQGDEESPIKITLIAPPLYVIITTSNDKNAGINLLNNSIKQIEQKITENGGSIVVKSPPRVVSAKDEHSLTVLLDQLREQNKEVSGDADSDEEYMTGDVEGM